MMVLFIFIAFPFTCDTILPNKYCFKKTKLVKNINNEINKIV